MDGSVGLKTVMVAECCQPCWWADIGGNDVRRDGEDRGDIRDGYRRECQLRWGE